MNINEISNGNKKISIQELNALEKIASNPENILESFDVNSLNKLKETLISQCKKYSHRKEVNINSKNYIKNLTNKAIHNIDNLLNKKLENLNNLEKDFPTISQIKELKKLINQRLITEKDVEKWIKKGWKTIKIHYQNGISERVKVQDLKKFFESVKKAQKYSIESAKEGISQSEDKKTINYKAISNYAQKHYQINSIETNKLKNLIAASQIFMGATENGDDQLSKKLQLEMKKFGLDIKNNPNDRWCAAFVGWCLIKAGFYKDIKDLKKHLPYPYPDVASNYLGLGYFPAHIGIYTGGGIMINGNSHNMVRYSKVNFKKLVGWLMPEDIGKPNKVHFYHKEKKEPPVGAILVFKRGDKKLPKKIAKLSGLEEYA